MHTSLPHCAAVVAVLLIGCGLPAVSPSQEPVVSVHGPHRDVELDGALSRRAQSMLDRVELMEGQSPGTRVSVAYDYGSGQLRINFDKAFLPENYGGAFEDQRDSITMAAIVLAETIGPVTLVEHHYGGQPAEYYFPEIAEEDARGRAGAGAADSVGLTSAPALDLLSTRAAQDILEQHQVRTSRSTAVSVTASVDIQRRQFVIRFGPGILPHEDDHSLEELDQYVRNTLEAYVLQAGVGEVETSILYEGKPYWEHFP